MGSMFRDCWVPLTCCGSGSHLCRAALARWREGCHRFTHGTPYISPPYICRGDTTTTTVTPTANSTTDASSGDTTTTTVTPTANSTTDASSGDTSTTTVTPPATTTIKPTTGDPCNPNPCGENFAKCIALYHSHVCQCPYGFYYSNSTCQAGKIFPGTVTLKQVYSKDIEDVNSPLYLEMFQNITNFFDDAFNLTDFKQTVIVEVNVTTGNARSENSVVNVTVMNIFAENTTETSATVAEKIMTTAKNYSYVDQYNSTTYCAVFQCDTRTTDCQESMFPQCTCKSNFSKTDWDDRSCSDCNSDCSAQDNEYCAREGGVPQCHCMINFKREGEKCVSCPVGYSGQNCENNSELILIIVGTIFGAIILSLVVAVSIVSVRAKRSQDPEKKSLIKPKYSSPDTSSETRIFPRVQTTSGHANPGYQPNPYEAHSSNRSHFLDGDYDDVYEISREPEGFRMQRR
uniref:Mucin 13, cell surface associated n=1 Tax=Anser cygnoides TaxID=8845 RepID=A0A8B9EBV2_ANSCY|nr:mucin-13 isoform X3 [Anser cygnoides]